MGITQNAIGGLRKWWAGDKERAGAGLKRGDDFVRYQQPGPHGTGYQQLSDDLRLDNDLMARFADYEEMDDYPEIACLCRGNKVAVIPPEVVSDGSMSIALQYVSLGELADRREQYPDEPLYVLAIDHARKRVVPARAKGPFKTGTNQPVVKVTFEESHPQTGRFGSESTEGGRQWSIRCTADHLFMLRDGSYKPAGDLGSGERLMPCATRVAPSGYSQVRSPWGMRDGRSAWEMIHLLVAEDLMLGGGSVGNDRVVHHEDEDKTNPHPKNLSIGPRADHSRLHTQNMWDDPAEKLKMVRAQTRGGKSALESNPDYVRKTDREYKTGDEHGLTIPMARDVLEAAVRTSLSVSEVAKKMKCGWNTAARRMAKYGIGRDLLGTSPGMSEIPPGNNHRVVSVEPDGFEDVYDIEVPGYHNFACEDVFVHNSACDVYADDATIPDMDHKKTIWATSKDNTVRLILEDLLEKRLRADEDIWPLTRNTVKYGNTYGEILATNEGVVGVNYLPTPTVRRVETKKGTLIGFVQDPKGQFHLTNAEVRQMIESGVQSGMQAANDKDIVVFEPLEMVHWRLQSKQIRSPYGHGVLEPARWLFRRLVMFEDSALIYKLTRSPARYAYYIDVGDLPPGQAMAYVNHIKREFRKKKSFNPSTGFLNLRHNPLGMNEDIWLPMRAGQETTRVDVLSGPDYQVVDDLEYFRGKLFSALKVPRAYLGFEPEASRAALSQIDVRFARTVMRIQREIRNGFKAIARVHLAILGVDPDQVEWDINMTIPSHIFELAQLELRSARMDLADRMREWVPQEWALENILKHSKGDAAYITKAKQDEERDRARRQAQVQSGIISDYPEAVQMGAGMVGTGEAEAARGKGQGQGEPGGGVPTESISRDELEEVLDGKLIRLEKYLKKLDAMEPKVEDLRRDMRYRRSVRGRKAS